MKMKKISVVVPTINPDVFSIWWRSWEPLLEKHEVKVHVVRDGVEDKQTVEIWNLLAVGYKRSVSITANELLKGDADLICCQNSSCKNLGLYSVSRYSPETDVVMVFDDDTEPIGDPIQDHLDVLEMRVPISWMTTMYEPYPRGFPYGVREEAPVKFSHGVWEGVPDLDAVTALATVDKQHFPRFYQGPIPKGIYAPICGMNIAFTVDLLPYVYFAPTATFEGAQRFDDIWMGVNLVRVCAEKNWAIYSDGSTVRHKKQSDLWANLRKEIVGLQVHERFWRSGFDMSQEDPFFSDYAERQQRWKQKILENLT